MKKLYLFTLLLFGALGQAQIVFPDPILKAKLLQSDVTNNIAGIYNPNAQEIPMKIDVNGNGEIELGEASVIQFLNIQNSGISDLTGLEYFTNLNDLYCGGNQIVTVNFSTTTCDPAVTYIFWDISNNPLETVNYTNTSNKQVQLFLTNPPTNFTYSDRLMNLVYHQPTVEEITLHGPVDALEINDAPNLRILNVKNGHPTGLMSLPGECPNLEYVCLDEVDMEISENVGGFLYFLENDFLPYNSYCSFTPGGEFYTAEGNVRFDVDGNGCDGSDTAFPAIRFDIADGTTTGGIITDNSGHYSIPVQAATHTITPDLENPAFFNVSPPSITVSFPADASPSINDFCVTANGAHPDLEVSIVPLGFARPGFDANYKLIYKNKGTVTLDGTVSFSHDNTVEYVGANPAVSSQTAQQLNWSFTGLQPFEQREIVVTMNVNSPTETPAVNAGDILTYTTSVTHGQTEETPNDNTATLNQMAVNSFDPNDKTCLEGNAIAPSMVGQYVHYKIRFENTGSANATNIVVKDVIDAEKFEISSLVPMDASHDFVTRISGNNVEFIFENIDLPFDDANNDGYVMFKIRTKPTLTVGDSFSNAASIYFDYNHPIVTEPAVTTVQLLGKQDFVFETAFALYPNPAQDVLHIQSKSSIEIQSIEVYNTLGQLVIATTDAANSIDVSKLKTGNYFVKIKTGQGVAQARFVKS